ncbi:MAG TPA: transglutaminase-like domain-containing protein [Thermoanaerobaculia bacterium]|nr:transglutaminase-like domain-containing protein [Thermoanaerobaculia bacterium]
MQKQAGFTARERFAALAAFPDRDIDIFEASLLIAAEEQPGLDPDPWLRRLDLLSRELWLRLEGVEGDFDRLNQLTAFLFGELGLRGNDQDYYDPRNNFIDQVLDRRLGIPLTLGIICMEVGRRVGIPLDGVGFPGHFLVRHSLHPNLILDPYEGGRLLTVRDCEEILERVSGGKLTFEPRLLRPVGPRQILVRMLNNLRGIYLNQGEFGRALSVVERVQLLIPEDPEVLRDHGFLSLQWGDPSQGIEELERYLDCEPEAEDQEEVRAVLAEARRRQAMPH